MSGKLHSSAVYGTAVLPAADRAPYTELWQHAVAASGAAVFVQ